MCRNTLVGGLLADHEEHGGEELLLAASDQVVGREREVIRSLLGAGRSQTEDLKNSREAVGKSTTPPRQAGNRERVVDALHVAPVTSQGPVPRHGIGAIRQILGVQQLEAGNLDGLEAF
jgi:hypothetical protein